MIEFFLALIVSQVDVKFAPYILGAASHIGWALTIGGAIFSSVVVWNCATFVYRSVCGKRGSSEESDKSLVLRGEEGNLEEEYDYHEPLHPPPAPAPKISSHLFSLVTATLFFAAASVVYASAKDWNRAYAVEHDRLSKIVYESASKYAVHCDNEDMRDQPKCIEWHKAHSWDRSEVEHRSWHHAWVHLREHFDDFLSIMPFYGVFGPAAETKTYLVISFVETIRQSIVWLGICVGLFLVFGIMLVYRGYFLPSKSLVRSIRARSNNLSVIRQRRASMAAAKQEAANDRRPLLSKWDEGDEEKVQLTLLKNTLTNSRESFDDAFVIQPTSPSATRQMSLPSESAPHAQADRLEFYSAAISSDNKSWQYFNPSSIDA